MPAPLPHRTVRGRSTRTSHPGGPARGRTVPVLLAAVVLVGGANAAAYAANGKPLLLGSSSSETRTATVKNSGTGPALSLKSRAGSPSLAVSSTKKVAHLNADLVDGVGADALRTTAYRYLIPANTASSGATVTFPGLPAGRYVASYAVITQASSGLPACYFIETGGTAAQGLSWAVSSTFGYYTNNATALVDTTAGPLTLNCNQATLNFYSAAGDAQSSVTLLRVDAGSAGTGTPTPARTAPQRSGAAATGSR